jgi:hypothetical protein
MAIQLSFWKQSCIVLVEGPTGWYYSVGPLQSAPSTPAKSPDWTGPFPSDAKAVIAGRRRVECRQGTA